MSGRPLLVLTAILLSGCARQHSEPAIVGIWALQPLHDGTATVAHYRTDGTLLLQPFNCIDPRPQPADVSSYTVAEDGQSIHLSSPLNTFDFKVLALTPSHMQLGRDVAGRRLTYDYTRVDAVAPLCALYPGLTTELARRTPYTPGDFVADPSIPAHTGMDHYVGKWASAENQMLLEIVRDAQGGYYLFNAGDENWHHLFNNVRWEGDELHFKSFAYSDNEWLFRHPYHKSQNTVTLQPTPDDRLRYTFFIDGERVSDVMVRVKD
ncbi:hypothetical protein PS3A_19310 [Pseudomonas sp. 3A(2025)]